MKKFGFILFFWLVLTGTAQAQSWLGIYGGLSNPFLNSESYIAFGVRFSTQLFEIQSTRSLLEIGAEHSILSKTEKPSYQPHWAVFGLATFDFKVAPKVWFSNALGLSMSDSQLANGLKFNALYEFRFWSALPTSVPAELLIMVYLRFGVTLFNTTPNASPVFAETGLAFFFFRW